MVPNNTRTGSDPYERELPKEYWEQLRSKDRYAQYRQQHPIKRPPPKTDKALIACLFLVVVTLLAVVLKPQPAPVRPAVAVATPTPTPPASPSPVPVIQQADRSIPSVTIAPRAEPVAGPMTTEGVQMLSGNQYWVTMPDGRRLLINYMGSVARPFDLPRFKGGANNRAYADNLGHHLWIWTLPERGTIPQWLDP